jgi:hypothetical protein
MQRNAVFCIFVKALHISGGFPAHRQDLKNCVYSIWYLLSLVPATPSVVEMELQRMLLKSVILEWSGMWTAMEVTLMLITCQ